MTATWDPAAVAQVPNPNGLHDPALSHQHSGPGQSDGDPCGGTQCARPLVPVPPQQDGRDSVRPQGHRAAAAAARDGTDRRAVVDRLLGACPGLGGDRHESQRHPGVASGRHQARRTSGGEAARRQRERPGGQDLRLGQGESVLRNPLDGLNIVLLDEVPHRVWRESIDPLGSGAQPGSTHAEVGA